MVVVDSSGWIEFFTDGPKADAYARYLKDLQKVATPAVVVYEIYNKITRERGEEMAKFCAWRKCIPKCYGYGNHAVH